MTNEIIFGERWISIEDIGEIANSEGVAVLNAAPEFIQKINRGADFLARLWQEKGVIYGVTTGYGSSCDTEIPRDLVEELPLHLTRFHGCGLGDYFTVPQTRAIIAVRLTSLALGKSGVRYLLLKHLELLLQHGIYPLIPSEGSVGASGDLTPLSYLAAVLIGERNVIYQRKEKNAADILKSLNIPTLQLAPKEALAIMNGTAVMTALACEAFRRSAYLCQLAARLTAMASIALQGNFSHFNEGLFAVKPHRGQMQIAAWIRFDLGTHLINTATSARLQDHYSLRCAPHVIGVLQDALPWFRMTIENEINSVNDNPVIDAEAEQIWHGGHFYGGHIAMVMDTMKTQVANLADLLDRQMALLTDTKFNQGLPTNLSGASKDRSTIHHGFKAVQISMSAWTAEALKHTMPASVFSRSTECHNQDKVSMGTIAARDCLRVLQLTEQVFAAHLLAVTQAVQLRIQQQQLNASHLSASMQRFLNEILSEFELVYEDRALEGPLRCFVQQIQNKRWALYHE